MLWQQYLAFWDEILKQRCQKQHWLTWSNKTIPTSYQHSRHSYTRMAKNTKGHSWIGFSCIHVNLTKPCPSTLAKAFNSNHPNKDTWIASYKEAYNGLLAHNTFTIINADEYHMIRKQTRKQAIPSMGILAIKPDGHGNPNHAKSCIIVLDNHKTMPWSESDCFAPVLSAPVICLMAALAVRNHTVLK